MRELVVDKKYNNKKLNTFVLAAFPELSLNMFNKALRQKDIKINGIRVKENVNVFENDVVLNNDGLIGIVTKTYDYYSIVTLITNKNSNISVKINDAIGILKTINNTLVVTDINNYEKVNVDDEIYTSGLGNLPDNIYIGKVKSINLNNTEIEKVIEVNINDRLEKLDYLFIRSNHD